MNVWTPSPQVIKSQQRVDYRCGLQLILRWNFPPDLFCWFLCNCCGCGGLNVFNYAALSPAHVLTITLGWLKSQMCAKKKKAATV